MQIIITEEKYLELRDKEKRIDKAIEYINEELIPYDTELYDEYQKIIDILKGSDSNENTK